MRLSRSQNAERGSGWSRLRRPRALGVVLLLVVTVLSWAGPAVPLGQLISPEASITTAGMPVAERAAKADQQHRASALAVYEGYSPALYEEGVRSSRYVSVSDGTRLAVDIYQPVWPRKEVMRPGRKD